VNEGSYDVVVVGSVNRDYVCSMDRLPRPGETVLGTDVTVGSGGKGGNQAVAAAYWGAACALVACVGDDPDGSALVEDLVDAGVDTSAVEVRGDVRSGSAFVLVAADGENSIVVAPGANLRLTAEQVTSAVSRLLRRGGVLVTQAEIPPEAIVAAVGTAATDLGARVVLNLAPYRELPAEALVVADPLVVNETEAGSLLGRPVSDLAAAREAARHLRARARSAVITLGRSGAVLATGGGAGGDVIHVPTSERPVVDSTGAGDAFTGVLAACLALGDDLTAAVRRGVAAGTYAVGRPGAQASFARESDLPADALQPAEPTPGNVDPGS
jgi:ribokinase